MDLQPNEKYCSCSRNDNNCNTRDETIDMSRTPSMGSLSIRDLVETPEPHELLSVSAVLHYCKCKILRPYLRLLAIMGLRPLNTRDISNCTEILWLLYTVQVLLFVLCGYILQYMACFRRDRGFCYEVEPLICEDPENSIYRFICNGSIFFTFVIPSSIHFFTYLYAVFLFRVSNNENLSSLMERVFLISTNPSDGSVSQKKLVKTLWLFIALSIVWMILSLISVNSMMAQTDIKFKWINDDSGYIVVIMKILLTVCTLWHDMIQATIITSYCLQGQLLISYLYFLRVKLILQPVRPVEWMKDLFEFKKFLKYFNNDLAPAVCLFTIINLSWSISGIIWLLNYDNIEMVAIPTIGISILNVILWLFISLTPFIQASRLTAACNLIKGVGHEVRIRPFAHQDTPTHELDSLLLYTSTLKISAKLYCIPINGKYLAIIITLSAIITLTLGQCHFLQI